MSEILSETVKTDSVVLATGASSSLNTNTNDININEGTDLLSDDIDDISVDSILSDISDYEANQGNMQTVLNHGHVGVNNFNSDYTYKTNQGNIQTVLNPGPVGVNNFQFPSSGFSISNINNSTIHFHFGKWD